MAKKVLTPEEYKSKTDKKVEKRKRFGKTFLTTFAYALACVIVFSSMVIAFTPNTPVTVNNGGNVAVNNPDSNNSDSENNVDTDNNADPDNSANTDNDADNSADTNTDTNADANKDNNSNNDSKNDSKDPANDSKNPSANKPADDKKALSNSSSAAEVVEYFNTAINRVKPNAKKITLVREKNSPAGDIEGNLPKSLTGLANSLIESNMGEKDLSKLDPGMVNATTVAQKNAMFPVENETWSSKLDVSDVEKFDVKDNGKAYKITLDIKADEPSDATDHGVGHCGKVFSVIKPSIVTDNAGAAANIIKEVKTGHKDGKVIIVVDKATGNVTSATYYFVWTLSLQALGINLSIPFGLQKDFTIAW